MWLNKQKAAFIASLIASLHFPSSGAMCKRKKGGAPKLSMPPDNLLLQCRGWLLSLRLRTKQYTALVLMLNEGTHAMSSFPYVELATITTHPDLFLNLLHSRGQQHSVGVQYRWTCSPGLTDVNHLIATVALLYL